MNLEIAKRHAIAMLRKRLASHWSRQEIIKTDHEGQGDSEARPGYLISAGRISFPGVLRHEQAAVTFRLAELIDEIEGQQRQPDLFGFS
ncbi:hypothetical protein [Stenotrophomonas acidaminiphila]|uniref:hypothetical protein n=1 Tax=Stenotrophomonas acidaminiphila TaxID=128780 RepID=UPI0015FAAD8A|nr:hypothetical protein [Stenotrophomonas acidaminiphila]